MANLHFCPLVERPTNVHAPAYLLKYMVLVSAFKVKDFLCSFPRYEFIPSDLALEILEPSEAFKTYTLAIEAAISICRSRLLFPFSKLLVLIFKSMCLFQTLLESNKCLTSASALIHVNEVDEKLYMYMYI